MLDCQCVQTHHQNVTPESRKITNYFYLYFWRNIFHNDSIHIVNSTVHLVETHSAYPLAQSKIKRSTEHQLFIRRRLWRYSLHLRCSFLSLKYAQHVLHLSRQCYFGQSSLLKRYNWSRTHSSTDKLANKCRAIFFGTSTLYCYDEESTHTCVYRSMQ